MMTKKYSYEWWYEVGYQDAKQGLANPKYKIQPYLDGWESWQDFCYGMGGDRDRDFINE